MSKGILIGACLAISLAGCNSRSPKISQNPDIVIRCKTVVQGTVDKVVKYKPIEVVQGEIGDKMLDSAGFLNYTGSLKENEAVGDIYIFKLWKLPEPYVPREHPFGFNCKMRMEIELPNGNAITE